MARSNCERCIHRNNCPYGRQYTECNDYEPEEDEDEDEDEHHTT